MFLIPRRRFEQLVADALDEIPEDLGALMDNVAVIVADDPPEPGVLGLYDGLPLTEREHYGEFATLPDRIHVYRVPICAMCSDEAEIVEQVRITVVHEVAHHFGIDDDTLTDLGWD
ncbi:MAG: metallopeptidase family protein [Acidimicrobiales bacterium]|nr:metallopeptidase family protein [Acidimicrobiales bacterium]